MIYIPRRKFSRLKHKKTDETAADSIRFFFLGHCTRHLGGCLPLERGKWPGVAAQVGRLARFTQGNEGMPIPPGHGDLVTRHPIRCAVGGQQDINRADQQIDSFGAQ